MSRTPRRIRGRSPAPRLRWHRSSREAEDFHGTREREGIRRDDAHVGLDVDEAVGIEALGIDDGRVDIGEYLEFVGATDVVAVARGAVGDDALSAALPHLARLEGRDHAVALRHATYPFVRFDAHRRTFCSLM